MCTAGGTITTEGGLVKSCLITVDDNAVIGSSNLSFTVNVINDNTGTKTSSDFTILIDGNSISTTAGQTALNTAGTHALSVTPIAGYAATFGGDCNPVTNTVTIVTGTAKNCTVTLNDVASGTSPTNGFYALVSVINDNGGTKTASDVSVLIDGVALNSVAGQTAAQTLGIHVISIAPLAGYTATIGGMCTAGGTITTEGGLVKTCFIALNDIAGGGSGGSGGGGVIAGGGSDERPSLFTVVRPNGGHRGHGTVEIRNIIAFMSKNSLPAITESRSIEWTPPYSNLTSEEEHFICSAKIASERVQRSKDPALKKYLVQRLSSTLYRDEAQILSVVNDDTLCTRSTRAIAQQTTIFNSTVVRADANGVLISSNPVWNACITGKGLTKDLIRSNKDVNVHRQGRTITYIPLTCRNYHETTSNTWKHPDHPNIRITLDAKGRLVLPLPSNYVLQKDAAVAPIASNPQNSASGSVVATSTPPSQVTTSEQRQNRPIQRRGNKRNSRIPRDIQSNAAMPASVVDRRNRATKNAEQEMLPPPTPVETVLRDRRDPSHRSHRSNALNNRTGNRGYQSQQNSIQQAQ